VQFHCRTSPIPKTGVGVHTKHEFLSPEPFLCFSQRTCPIHYFRSNTHVWGGFVQFRCRTFPIRKRVSVCIQSTSFCHRNHFFVFRNEHAQSTNLGPKLMFGVVSRNFVAARHPFRKRVSGCIRSMSFCQQNHFFVFSQRTCPIHYFRSKTHVWSGFVQFRCRTSPIRKQVSGCIQARVFATGTVSSFFAMNMPNPLI
jgi:RNA polymerase subunit RPABC4/transcription elongation factor Spt4